MSMNPVVLYRRGMNRKEDDDEELKAIKEAGLKYIHLRTNVGPEDLVIGRYSVLPFYQEVNDDIQNNGGKLINTSPQHHYIADMQEWYEDLKDLTPKLYPRLQDIPETGLFVLKGQTNSK